jgi:undecaprenyl-diphosphatase
MMENVTHPKGLMGEQIPANAQTAGGENKRDVHKRHIVEVTLWVVGFLLLVWSVVMVRMHPGPWPIDLETTRTLQSWHLWPPLRDFVGFISSLNDPIPSTVALVLWLAVLCFFRKFQQGIFIAFGSAIGDGLDGIVRLFANRPRPSSSLIHVFMPEPFTSYPSGHTEHDTVYYGFLLYLSFTKPMREWRYFHYLLPLQIFAVIAMLSIGFSRILEGSHWLTDTLGGYLCGLLLLYGLIFTYRLTTDKLAERHAKKQQGGRGSKKSGQHIFYKMGK